MKSNDIAVNSLSSEKSLNSKVAPSFPPNVDDIEYQKDQFDQIFNQDKFSEAALILDQIEKKWPNSSQYLEGRSRLLVRTREWEKAKDVLKECLSSFPQSKSCLVDLASTEMQIGSKEEQEAAIADCTAKMPNELQCKNMLAILKMNQGKYNEAVLIYQQLIRENGSYGIRFPEAMLNWQLGIALEGAGRVAEAQTYFHRACQENWPGACEKI